MEAAQLAEAFHTNVISAQMVTSAMLPALRRSTEKKIVMMSTTLGSLALAEKFRAGRAYPYKITKAAMNMLMVQYAFDLEKEGFTVIGTSPGWLKTDLGSQYADLDVSVGVEATLKNILGATTKDNGRFLNIHVPGWEKAEGANQYAGGDAPW
ncbi:hypothetical protein Golomagni_06303 [Golovinomyces magnicellulatus]|nr:hypothetical protein Golomagni_06303 [Golovinomyces magnicellulatus]